MIVPFVNWFLKPSKPKESFREQINMSSRWKEYVDRQREYESRLSHFESELSPEQYTLYMGLRSCANELLIAKNSIDFAMDLDENITKKLGL